MLVHVYMYVMHANVHMHIHVYIYIYICMYTYIHIYIYINTKCICCVSFVLLNVFKIACRCRVAAPDRNGGRAMYCFEACRTQVGERRALSMSGCAKFMMCLSPKHGMFCPKRGTYPKSSPTLSVLRREVFRKLFGCS